MTLVLQFFSLDISSILSYILLIHNNLMSLQRSNTNRSGEVSQQSASQANHFLQKAVKVMRELTQAEKSLRGLQNEIKLKKLTEINRNLELAARKDSHCISILVENKVLVYIKHFFSENITKTPALAFLRLLIPAQLNPALYLSHNIPLLVARVLERDENRQRGGDWEQEAVEALKLIAEWVQHFPEGFPRVLATTLVSLGELPATVGFQEKKKDHITQHIKLLAIDVLLALTAKDLDLALQAGAFSLLVAAITDPAVHQRSQDILIRVLYFMNQRSTRQKVWTYVDLRRLFSVFTDLDYVFFQQSSRSKGNVEFMGRLQTQLSLARQALLTLLKSWTGIALLAAEGSVLTTILEALKQVPKKQDSEVRRVIYTMLEEILSVGEGLLGGEFVQDDFRASSLLSSYMVALLRLLMQHGLFKLLIQLSGIDQPPIADPAQRLLRKLSIYIFNFLPDAANYMDFLVSAGTKSGPGSAVLKHSSSFIVSKIGNFVFDAHKEFRHSFLGEIEYIFNLDSIFMPLSRTSILAISKNLNFLAYRQVPNYRRRLLDLQPIPKEHKQNFKKWDWNAIIDLLSFPDVEKEGGKPNSADRYKEFKLFKYLLRFYSYSRGNFAEQKWSTENLLYVKAGKLLIQNTLMIPDNFALVKNPPESQFECNISFMGELEKILQTALEAFTRSSTAYYPNFFKTLERQLILWIGSFTHTKIGYQTLVCENHFFAIIDNYLGRRECALLIAGLMFYFDFYRDNLIKRFRENGQEQTLLIGPKALLTKAVKQGSKPLRLMAIEVIKLLYRAELSGFTAEGVKLLVGLAAEEKQEQQVWAGAVETLQTLAKDRQLLESLLSLLIETEIHSKSSFAVLRDRLPNNLVMRLCQVEEGYRFVEEKLSGWLQAQYQRWVTPEASQKYFDHLESLLSNCLNFSKKQHNGYRIETQGKDFIRWAFLYKLPWLLYINEAEEVPLLIKLNQDTLLLYAEFTEEQYDFRSTNPDNMVKVCLGVGSIFLDEDLAPTKTKTYTSINLNSNSLVSFHGHQYYCASHRGVSVYFLLRPQGESYQEVSDSEAYANSYDIRRIHVQVKLSSYHSNEELPLHLIQQLTKTPHGMAFLEKKQLTQHAAKVLTAPNSSTLEVRSVLWSLGYYGSTKDGMATIVKEGLADKILGLSTRSPTLSLRGTCRYVLNMFCHSEEGRNFLSRNGLNVNKKLLSCAPEGSQISHQLDDNPQLHLSENPAFWKQYQSALVPLPENEAKLFQSITLLVNSLASKYAIAQIKELIKTHPKITFSFPLLQNVITLMSYFKMKYESRKTIHFIFDDFLKSSEFGADGHAKIIYPTRQDPQPQPESQNV